MSTASAYLSVAGIMLMSSTRTSRTSISASIHPSGESAYLLLVS